MNKERLLNVAKALRESEHPEKFSMRCHGHVCGTPACALGHYAARGDLQDVFRLDHYGDLQLVKQAAPYKSMTQVVQEHFGINEEQDDLLFGAFGCGDARAPADAIEYIERFVAAHS